MKNIKLWLTIIRPKTLFASLCPVLLAFVLAANETVLIDEYPLVFAVTLICALCLQILSNLVNDYFDFVKGLDKSSRVGPKRALAEGVVDKHQMKNAIEFTLLIIILSGAFLIYMGGIKILAIGISAIIFAYLYTATSYSLSYLGIADIFVFLYYGLFAVCGTFLLLTNECLFCMPKVIYSSSVCGLISMMLLMINNLRDIEEDKSVNKKTIPVRFGKRTGEIIFLIYALLCGLFSYLAFGLTLPIIIVIPALALFVEVLLSKKEMYNKCLVHSGWLNIFYVLLVSLHYLI